MIRRLFLGSIFLFPVLSLSLATPTRAKPVKKITRPELKALSAPMYFPGVGIEFTEELANDAASLKVTALDGNGYRRQDVSGGAAAIELLPDCLYYVVTK